MGQPWACSRRGDCCREPAEVVMSEAEAALIHDRRADLRWRVVGPGFVALEAHPCPLLDESGQCTVYEIRPYNCRRFLCFREEGEAFQPDAFPVRVLTNRADRRVYETNQRHAMRWARLHGWKEEG